MSFDFSLPLRQPDSPTETIIFLVEWGDGQSEVMTLEGGNNWNPAIYTHSYANNQARDIKIYPLIGETFGKYWNFGSGEVGLDRLKLKGISQWGSFQFDRSGGAFEGCSNLSFSSVGGAPSFGPAGDPPNSPNNALARAFKGCSSLSPSTNAFIDWNITNVNSLSETFSGCINLNVNLNNWDASNVRTTYRMFYNCPTFNNNIQWTDVSNLENMSEMFSGATNFAGEIFANWDSTSFSDGSNKTSSDISGMFKGTKFNGANVSTWDVSNISNFSSVFEGATLFTDQLGGLHDWDTGEGTNFYNMFNGATSFNRDISQWDTSKGTNFNSMFEGATIFNQNINTGAEINKHGGLYNPWTIRSDVAVTMDNMLTGASAFDQDISDWDVTNISSATNLLTGTNLSVANALEINDSSTGWPSQGGASAAVTNESAAAVQASGTAPAITSHSAQGSTYTYANPENTQTTVNLVATGAPVPTLSLANNSAAIDKDKFTLVDNGDGTGTLKLTNAPNFESPTDDAWAGQNTYAVYVHATNAVGSANAFFNFNVTDVSDVAAPVINTLSLSNATSDGFIANWDSIGAGYTYHYQVATDSGFSNIINEIDNYSGTEVVQVSLAADTTYYFRVKANGGGLGSTYEADSPSWGSASIDTAAAVTTDVTEIGAGYGHSLFRKSDGSLWGVGRGTSGQLGDGTTASRNSPVQISSSSSAQFAGGLFTVFVKPDGSLWGTGDTFASLTPVEIVPSGVINVAAGHYHIVFVKSDGSLWAMGNNGAGQLGDGTTTGRASPVQILPSGVTQVFAGSQTTHFLKSDGSLWGMGANFNGQLGDGTTSQRNSPVQILASGVVAVTKYGGSQHTLFLKSDGSLWGTGQNFYGQLGVAPYDNRNGSIREIVPSGVISMAAGYAHSLFLKSNGSLWAMGRNDRGQLGDGTITQRNSPVQILASGVTKVTAGYQHSFFQKSDDSIWGMGTNAYGVLGSDAPDDSPGDATGPYAFSPIRL